MSLGKYEDRSYAPIGTNLEYTRGDGAKVTLSIEPSDRAATALQPRPSPAPSPRPSPRPLPVTGPIFDLDFDDGEAPVAAPAPAIPLAPPLALNPDVHFQPTPATELLTAPTDDSVYDNPLIGGKYTVFVLLYGPPQFHNMHVRCVQSIIASVPQNRLDLRIGSNELCPQSVTFVDELVTAGIVTKHYRHRTNDKKYPVMREMFYDPDLPIDTKWLLWFDDDSIADKTPNWLRILSEQIVKNPTGAMFGAKLFWNLGTHQANHYRRRPWYKGKLFRDKHGRPIPNGSTVHFATGGFWALRTDAMRACGIPDDTLGHNGGDYTIGEQLYQGGFELRPFNGQKQFVHTSSVKRRGLDEKHFGMA